MKGSTTFVISADEDVNSQLRKPSKHSLSSGLCGGQGRLESVPKYVRLTAMLTICFCMLLKPEKSLCILLRSYRLGHGGMKLSQMLNYGHELAKNPLTRSLNVENGDTLRKDHTNIA